MPTNRELTQEILELSEELGVEISTDRMNHAALTELASRLRTQREATRRPVAGAVRADAVDPVGDTDPPEADESPDLEEWEEKDVAPEAPKAEPEAAPVNGAGDGYVGGPPPAAAPAVKRYPYAVAPGRALSCGPRGILGPGKEVRASDFEDGQKQLDHLVDCGHVIKS